MARGLILASNIKPKVGGAAEHAHQISLHLQRLGEEILVLADAEPSSSEFDSTCGYRIRRFKPGNDIKFDMPIFSRRARLLRWILTQSQEVKPDYLLLTRWTKTWGRDALLASLISDLPLFSFAHGSEISRTTGNWLTDLVRRTTLKSSSHVFSNSRYTRTKIVELGVKANLTSVNHLGIDTSSVDRWISLNKEKGDLDLFEQENRPSKIMLTVGRLEQRKGFDKVIEALPLVQRNVPDVKYVVIGAGPYAPALHELTRRLKLGDAVWFIGQVSDHEKFKWYQRCDVFVMPNRELEDGDFEGFGIVFLEANAFCKPVVAGCSGGAPDAVTHGKTGMLVDPMKPHEISRAVSRLLLDESYAKTLGSSGRRKVETEHQWVRLVNDIRLTIHGKLDNRNPYLSRLR